MGKLVISQFNGLSPRFDPNQKVDYREGIAFAKKAENIDLTSGKIRPLADHFEELSLTTPYNSLCRFKDEWMIGNDRYYCPWRIGTLELLFYLDSGVLKKLVNGISANVGQIRLSAPTVVSQAAPTVTDLTDGTYKWTKHGTSKEYYCELAAGGDPSLLEPEELRIDGNVSTEGSMGTLAPGEWDYGDNDSLGYQTVYVRLPDNADPDDKSAGYIEHVGGINHLIGTYNYFITTTRDVGGHIDESGPSEVSDEIEVTGDILRVTRPAISYSYVTHWNLYRISNPSGAYQFVVQLAASVAYYDDNIADADLDTAATTWYTSEQGNEIIFDAPPTFDGIIQEPYSGMIFGWKDSTLYWPEPGYPDAWPSFYTLNFPSRIKRVIPFAGTLAVLTEKGPFRVDGTNPELLQQSKVLGTEPCVGTAACPTAKGVVYLSDSGLVLFNLVTAEVVSDALFTEKWFSGNVNPTGAVISENDNILYLFHSGGTLMLDMRGGNPLWTTLSLVARAAYRNEDDGWLYIIDLEGVKKLCGKGTDLEWWWESGNILMDTGSEKNFISVEVIGSGAVSVEVLLDEVFSNTKAIDFETERGRTLRIAEDNRTRALRFAIKGTGEVEQVIVRSNA